MTLDPKWDLSAAEERGELAASKRLATPEGRREVEEDAASFRERMKAKGAFVRDYDPNQPRGPKKTKEGGQFIEKAKPLTPVDEEQEKKKAIAAYKAIKSGEYPGVSISESDKADYIEYAKANLSMDNPESIAFLKEKGIDPSEVWGDDYDPSLFEDVVKDISTVGISEDTLAFQVLEEGGFDWFELEYDAAGGLSEHHKYLNIYTGEAYEKINKVLRSGHDYDTAREKLADIMYDEDSGIGVDLLGRLDEAFEDTALRDEMIVYRNMRSAYYKVSELASDLDGGDAFFTDRGFVSTTLIPINTPTSVRIILREGAKALPIAHISEHAYELEILLARNAKFKVHGYMTANGSERPDKMLTLEYLGPADDLGYKQLKLPLG